MLVFHTHFDVVFYMSDRTTSLIQSCSSHPSSHSPLPLGPPSSSYQAPCYRGLHTKMLNFDSEVIHPPTATLPLFQSHSAQSRTCFHCPSSGFGFYRPETSKKIIKKMSVQQVLTSCQISQCAAFLSQTSVSSTEAVSHILTHASKNILDLVHYDLVSYEL